MALRLVKVKGIWINPESVVAVDSHNPPRDDQTRIYLAGTDFKPVVHLPLNEVVSLLTDP